MADSINNKAKEYYDNDDTGGSLNNNLKDFLKQQGAEGNSLNTLWRNYAYGEGGNSLNTRLGKLWGTSGSLISRWKDVLGLTWDELKLFFNARRNDPELLLSGATSFDGSNDYIQLASDGRTDFANQSFTISAWIKPSTVGSDNVIFSYDFTSHVNPYYAMHLRTQSSGKIAFRYNNGAGTNDSIVSGTNVITAGVWQHVSATYTSGTQKVYVNGSVVVSGTDSYTITFYDQEVWIGKANYSGSEFNGSIANVGIWNRALSASEIESIYWKGQYADLKGTELTNLVSWYNLSADANDSTGTNNGTNNGATFLTDAYSASSPFLPRIQDKASDTVANYGEVYGGNAVSFDGTNDYINIDSVISSISSNTVGTLSTWVNFADLTTDFDTLFGFTDGGSSGTNRFVLRVNNTNNELNVHYASGGTIQWKFETDNTYNTGQWYFLQLVQDGTEPKLYIDGTEQSITYTTATDKTQWFNNLGTFSDARIGCEDIGGNTRFISGKINNVKIFSTALTQDQVRELYTKPELTLPTGIASSALKLDMPMQEGSGTAILDGSGNQNHGTGSGITWANGQEYGFQHPLVRSNNPMVFDGSDDKVTIGDSSSLDGFTKFSISAYVYQKTLSTGGIIKKYATQKSYILYLDGSGKVYLVVSSDGSNTEEQISVGSITAGIWNHVLITFDAGTFKAYINGSSVGVNANFSTQTSVFAGSADAVIGNAIWSGYYFDGLINDVAVWDSALTANEVTALYNSGLPLLPTTDSGNYASTDDLVGYWRNDGVTTWLDRTPTDDPELVTNGNFSGWTVESGDAFTIESDGTFTVANTSTDSTIEYSFEAVVGRTYRWNTTSSSSSGTGLLYYIKQPNAGFVSFSPYRWSLTNYDFVATATGTITLRLYKYGGHNGNGVMATASIIRERGGNNGTVSGSPASIIVPEGLNEGRDSQGYYLTDTDSISSGIRFKGAEYISVQDSESLSFGNGTSDSPFSLEAWIKFSDVTNSTIISKGVYNTDAEYNFNIHSGNDLTLLLFDESVADTIQGQRTNTTLVANENQWTHVVSTYDGRGGTSANAGIKLYVNGAVVSSSAVTTGTYVAMENLGADVYIGKQTTNYAKGSIDEAKVYAKELSATEVLKNYNNGKSAHTN